MSGRAMNKRKPEISFGGQSVSKDDIEAATRLVHSLERMIEEPRASNADVPTQEQLVRLAKRLRDMRKSRCRFFDENLFGEPGWDMILSLFISDVEGYRLKVTDLMHESQATPSTALRWIDRLAELGLVQRRENPFDRRSQFVEMPADGIRKTTALLETVWATYFPFD